MSFDLKIKNGDLVFSNGDLQKVVDTEKLEQDILKICLTSVNANPLHPWYGSFLSRTVVGSAQYTNMLSQIAKTQLSTALDNLRQLQINQISYQRVSADEQLNAVSDISVIRNKINPMWYNVAIKVITKGFKKVETSFKVSTI